MFDRRLLLKLSGLLAAAGALEGLRIAIPSGPTQVLRTPGTYQISGQVRLHDPLVEISGITNAQQIAWSPGSLRSPVASFSSFEHFDRPWQMPEIRVRGGQLESVTAVRTDFA